MIIAILTFIIILAVLVLAHEFGHFIMAKRAGMQVLEFGFGFPPRLSSVKKGDTRYSINLIPLGGFVKILGENNEAAADPRSFINKSFWQRFLTLVAGVVMNFILAWVLFSIGFMIGLPTVVAQGQALPAHALLRSEAITILDVAAGSPAQKAGMLQGDKIVSIDSKQFSAIQPMIDYVHAQAGKNVSLQIKRGSATIEATALSRPDPPKDQGAIGIALGEVGNLSYPWYLAPLAGLKATGEVIAGTASAFYHLIFQGQGIASLGGPVKIASLTGQVSRLGFAYILQFAAFLSVNLGILNIVPFPALDGGRVLFLVIEKVRGKRNNEKVEQWFNTAGFALLMILILFITARDIKGLF